jgi:DNA replication protein DnaC
VVDQLRNRDYQILEDLIELDVLVLDEIGAEATSPFVMEKLCRLFNGRLNKWTIITGNVTPDALGTVDNRPASRLFRDRNVVLAIKTVDFARRS